MEKRPQELLFTTVAVAHGYYSGRGRGAPDAMGDVHVGRKRSVNEHHPHERSRLVDFVQNHQLITHHAPHTI
jgi:hypothetical protein